MKDKGVKCFKCNEYGHIAKLCKGVSTPKGTACIIAKSSYQKQVKQVEIANQCFVSIIDTGSDLSLMNRDSYEKIGRPTYKITFHVVDNGIMKQGILIGADFLNLVELHSVKD